ncbi:MAG TPA: alpha/beta fold hydrolase [Propionibacteriaceae bacterium]
MSLFSTQVGDTGPRVVFLHGLFGQGRNWTTVAKALQPYARVTLVDLPNHGRSDWTEDFAYPEMAAEVAHLLATQGAGEPYAVVGHSMGGKVAMALALQHPELVSQLCVVDVSPVPTTEISNFATYVEGMRTLDLQTLPDRVSADELLRPYVPQDTIRSFLLQNLRRELGGSGWRWQMNLALLGDHLDTMGSWPDLDLPPYPGSVLWLAGSESRYVRREYAPAMRALFPRVQLVTVKAAGHWVHSDQPEVFGATMRRFLHLE